MRTYFKTFKSTLTLVMVFSGLCSKNSSADELNIAEKQTVKFMEAISKNDEFKKSVENSKNVEKDSIYLSSHERENVVAHNSEIFTDDVMNAMSKQFVKAVLGSYKDEIKNAWLSLDLASDEPTLQSEFQVASYDRQNFELAMQAKKNNALHGSESLISSIQNHEKGRWRVRPRVGSSTGAIFNYYHSQINLEFRVTSAEQSMNVHRSLKDISADVFYNVNVKANSSSLTLSKTIASNLSLQVQRVGKGASALNGVEDKISLNFGRGF